MTISKHKQSTQVTQSNPTTSSTTLLQGPPDVEVPTVPSSFDPENAPATSPGVFPRKEEVASLDAAVKELERRT